MKKLILLMVALPALCACDSEMTTEEQIETLSLAASKVEKGHLSEMNLPKGYSDLGIVPQDAQAKNYKPAIWIGYVTFDFTE